MPTISFPPRRSASALASITADHVAIRVPDLARTVRWYTEHLDFRLVHQWPFGELQLAYLAPPDDDRFLIELIGGEGAAPPVAHRDVASSLGVPGYHHLCLRVDDVEATLAELRRRGVAVVAEPFTIEDIGRRLAFVADLWGTLIELASVLR